MPLWGRYAFGFAGGALLVALCAGSLRECEGRKRDREASTKLDARVAALATHHKEITSAKARVTNLSSLLDEAENERGALAALVQSLEGRSSDVREVTRWVSRVEPSVGVVKVPHKPVDASDPSTPTSASVSDDLPREHLFRLRTGVVVARFGHTGTETTFETYPQEWRASLVSGAKGSTLLLEGRSGYSDRWFETPVASFRVDRFDTPKRSPFDLRLGLGVYIDTHQHLTGRLTLDWFEPLEGLALFGPHVGGSKNVARLGVDVAAYNVGKPLPVVDDLWLRLGVSGGFEAVPWSVGIGVGTRF